jgi:uncharacterized protein (TIGR02391 family)
MQRPLTKERLKEMFVLVLWGIKHNPNPDPKLRGSSGGIDSILSGSLAFYFDLKNIDPDLLHAPFALTKEEKVMALEGVEELNRAGCLKQDTSQGTDNFKLLTEKGIQYAESLRAGKGMVFSNINIDDLLSNQTLLNAVRDDYLNSRYEKAIVTAFKMVEEAVRTRAGEGPGVYGHKLMVKAFQQGKLTHPDAATPSEKDALFLLFAGCNGLFRDPSAHRTVGYNDPQEAAHILGLANLLLGMVDKCTV